MRVFNRVKTTRRTDYVVIELGFSVSENPNDQGEPTETFTLPLTSAADLAIELFRSTLESSADVTAFYFDLQSRINALNAASKEVDARKAAIAAPRLNENE